MKRIILAGAALFAAPLTAQSAALTELPRLMGPRAVASLPAAAPTETIRYGEAPSQLVELFMPKPNAESPDALHPVVIMVHGGCWRKDIAGPELLRPAAGAFIDKGYAVWSIGYRRIDEEGGGYPGTYQDVAQAIDLIREHAEARKLDLNRLVFYGHSAGAHLALWAAGRGKIPAGSPLHSEKPLKPRGVVSVGGIGSLANWSAEINTLCGPDTVEKLAPKTAADGSERADDLRFADTSPDKLLPLGVPVVMLHGVYDAAAFPAIGLDFAIEARKAGDKADIWLAPVAGHFEVIAPGTRPFAQAVSAVEAFAK
ncbi:alpha/beta hydrolase [Sandaracinobacter neustonicus]|uniref:Alpha/beta hydrolase n=1 Tax=Sandaracinobacter neustonicus TaxID=1715348 RepID=A0A501XTS2_9SPHN|nr:alpha/beta hydrolase [Sandaracinobacter neustonicus]TPE63976.1 alpha/beta hydrolase [Sandaracinobacter neustonicus]